MTASDKPNRTNFTGHSIVALYKGVDDVLLGDDVGYLEFGNDGTAEFVTNIDLSARTNRTSTRGQIVATGMMRLATGETWGTYSGTICIDR